MYPGYLLKATSIGSTYLDTRPMTPILSTCSRRETQLLNRPRKPEVNAKDITLKSLLADHLGLEPPSMQEEPLVSEKILSGCSFVHLYPPLNSNYRLTQLHLPRQILKETMSLLQTNPWFSAVSIDPGITNKKHVSKLTSEFLRPASPLPAMFDPKIRLSPPIFSSRLKEKPREYLTRDGLHSMLTRATIDDDIDIDTEHMAIASGGWGKSEHSFRCTWS